MSQSKKEELIMKETIMAAAVFAFVGFGVMEHAIEWILTALGL